MDKFLTTQKKFKGHPHSMMGNILDSGSSKIGKDKASKYGMTAAFTKDIGKMTCAKERAV